MPQVLIAIAGEINLLQEPAALIKGGTAAFLQLLQVFLLLWLLKEMQ